jgi:hypothetical protein
MIPGLDLMGFLELGTTFNGITDFQKKAIIKLFWIKLGVQCLYPSDKIAFFSYYTYSILITSNGDL